MPIGEGGDEGDVFVILENAVVVRVGGGEGEVAAGD